MSIKSKHRDRQFFIARGVFGLAALILIALVVFIAVRAGDTASADETVVMVQPSADLRAAESTIVPLPAKSEPASSAPPVSPSASASASASSSPSASATPSKSSSSPKPSKSSSSPKPSVTKTTTPPPSVVLAVSCSTNSWGSGFITNVTVNNRGTKAGNYSVSVGYSPNAKIVSGPWSNARATTSSGGQLVFKGNESIAAGGSATFAFQGGRVDRQGADVRQTGCSVAVAAG